MTSATPRSFFRIHKSTEAIETVLDPARADGWVASDEERETQPHGVSCCLTLDDMARYVRQYSMYVAPGDKLLELRGYLVGEDRDRYAVRAEIVEIVGELPLSSLDGL